MASQKFYVNLEAPDGTAAAPSYSFASDPGIGMFSDDDSDQLKFATGGLVRMVVSNSGIHGSGTGIYSLNASNISHGTVAAARLPAFAGDVTSPAGSNHFTLANSGVSAGTYTKVTVDAKGRVTAGASMIAGDLPSHTHAAGDIASGILPVARGGTGLSVSSLGSPGVVIGRSDGYDFKQGNTGQVFVGGGMGDPDFTNINASYVSDFSEAVDDRVAALLVAGTNITLNYNDAANTLTINSTASGGSTSLGGLTDVTLSSPVAGNVLRYSGSAWVNYAESNYLNRSNHTGTQLAATISNFNAAAVSATSSTYVPLAGGTMTGSLLLPNGTAGIPAYSFSGDTNTGVFWVGADQLGLSTGGVNRVTISSAGINMISGQFFGVASDSVTIPTYSWSGDTNTGMYWVGADQIGFTTGGIQRMAISTSAVTQTVPSRNQNGTAAVPVYSFSSEPGTGMYIRASGVLGFSINGQEAMSIQPAGITLGFTGDVNLYRLEANVLRTDDSLWVAETVNAKQAIINNDFDVEVMHWMQVAV